MSPRMVLVCGTIRGPDAGQAVCSDCGATIWPTLGSLQSAQAHELPMICIDCYLEMKDSVFAGFMYQGAMLPKRESVQLFEEVMKHVYGPTGRPV